MLLFFLFFLCVKREIIPKEPPYFNIKEMIDSLENGFSFEWKMNNKIMNFKAKGDYIGLGKYKIEGDLFVDGKREEIGELNPYEIIKVVTGQLDFKFKGIKDKFYIFNFTSNLFFLDPINGLGKGEIFIKDSAINSIVCSGDETYFYIKLSKNKTNFTKYYIEYEGNIKKILERMILLGEKEVSIEKNILRFKETRDLDERIFNTGDVKFLLLKSDFNGLFKDPLDSLFKYNIVCTLNLFYKDVNRIYDQKGRPSITISIEENIEGYIGLFIDNNFVSCGIGKKIIYFPFKEEVERDLYYSIIVSGSFDGKIKNYRRLK